MDVAFLLSTKVVVNWLVLRVFRNMVFVDNAKLPEIRAESVDIPRERLAIVSQWPTHENSKPI